MRVIMSLARFIAFSYALCMGCAGAVAPISRIPTGILNDGGRRNGTQVCNFNPSEASITASSDNNGLIVKVSSPGEDFTSEAFITDNTGRERGCGSTVASNNGEVIFAIAIDQFTTCLGVGGGGKFFLYIRSLTYSKWPHCRSTFNTSNWYSVSAPEASGLGYPIQVRAAYDSNSFSVVESDTL